jgi:hypothetical protein
MAVFGVADLHPTLTAKAALWLSLMGDRFRIGDNSLAGADQRGDHRRPASVGFTGDSLACQVI